MRLLLACTALALALSAAEANGATRNWTCTAIGWRTIRQPAPQRIPFTSRGETKSDAMHAAMRKCKASHDVNAGSCGAGPCQKS